MTHKPTRKTYHQAFQITATFEVWIEENDERFHVFQRLRTAGSMPVEVNEYADKAQAIAHCDAIKALFAPNIIEGSEVDVTSFRKGNQ